MLYTQRKLCELSFFPFLKAWLVYLGHKTMTCLLLKQMNSRKCGTPPLNSNINMQTPLPDGICSGLFLWNKDIKLYQSKQHWLLILLAIRTNWSRPSCLWNILYRTNIVLPMKYFNLIYTPLPSINILKNHPHRKVLSGITFLTAKEAVDKNVHIQCVSY